MISAAETVAAFKQQVFLGRGSYVDTPAGDSHALLAVGGRILRAEFGDDTVTLTDLNQDDRNNPSARTYFQQAENYLVIQNGMNYPFIYDGNTLRRSRTGDNNPYYTVSSVSGSEATRTITTDEPHPFGIGDYVDFGGVDAGDFQTQFYVRTVPSPTTFTIDATSGMATGGGSDIKVRFCPEVPVGTLMCYGQGRLFVASPDFTEFLAGDLVYGDVDNSVANLLRFTETTYLSEGGAFKLPTPAGRITGMRFVSFQDTSTGQGDLVVYGEHGAGSFDVSIERTLWKSSGIQKVLFTNIGCTSDDSIVDFNGDQFFRSLDGERSYRMARADAFSYGQTPVSAEVSKVLDRDDPAILDHISGINFDNRLLFTCAPSQSPHQNSILSVEVSGTTATVTVAYPHNLNVGDVATLVNTAYADGVHSVTALGGNTVFSFELDVTVPSEPSPSGAYVSVTPVPIDFSHGAVVPLDFTPLSSNSNKAPAAYQGVWYGADEVRSLFTISKGRDKRAFFVGKNTGGENTLVEILRSFGGDLDEDGNETPISSWIEGRALVFDKPLNLKRLVRADLWLDEIVGTVDFRVYFRPDQCPTWFPWYDFSVSGPADDSGSVDPLSKTITTGAPRYKTQISLPPPPDLENETDARLARYGFSFQVRVEWDGSAQITKFVAYANDLVEGLQQGAQRG